MLDKSHPRDGELQAYLDGEIDDAGRQSLAAHLCDCLACRQRLETWRSLSRSIGTLLPPDDAFGSPGAFWARLAGQLEQRRGPTWPVLALLPGFLALAVATVLLALLNASVLGLRLYEWGAGPNLDTVFSQLAALGAQTPSWVNDILAQRFGWLSMRMAREIFDQLSLFGPLALRTLVHVGLWVILGGTLFLSVVMGLVWIGCWARPTRSAPHKS
mgnify:CR=1 FL=1